MNLSKAVCVGITLASLGLSSPPVAGQAFEIGPEFWVDGPAIVQPGLDRDRPHVATDEEGRRIYVWDAFFADGGDRGDIFVRRFDAQDSPLGDPFFVNTTTSNDQRWPRVAAASDGSFLVTYESFEMNLAGTGVTVRVRSQAFDSNGATVGGEQLLSTLSTETYPEASTDVAALRVADGSPGGYVVVWESALSSGNDNSGQSIQARLIASNGVPVGAQFQVNSNTAGWQYEPSVCELADGGFLVVFKEDAPSGVRGRRFTAAGQPVGDDFAISEVFSNGVNRPDAAIGWDGRIAVVWEDWEAGVESTEIRARVYDRSLVPLGTDFRINTVRTDFQSFPSVADHGPWGFLVSWDSDVSSGNDAEPTSVEARFLTGHNAFDGPQFQLNVFTEERQARPGSGGWYGRLAVAWYSSDGNNQTVDDVIAGAQIESCLFCDDFEWGSSWRWSNTVGPMP